jgi:hypothetical protein
MRKIQMNDKIKQLAKQAEQYVNNAMDERANNKDFTFVDIDEMYNTKFAKLIVRECMEVVINGQYSASECHGNSHRISYNNGRTGASSDIKKHFGVEL